MILVDTSVWIDFVRGRKTEPVARLRITLDRGVTPCLTSLIFQEILQGADSERAFRDFSAFFSGQKFLQPFDTVASYGRAARLYFDCRRKGVTIRSTNDCVIAQIALEHDVPLLHDDRNFVHIATAAPRLKFA